MSEQKLRLAHIYLQQADVHRQKSELEPAIAAFTKAISLYKEMAKDEPAVWAIIADTIESVAATYKAAGELDKASETLKEAAQLREQLVKVEQRARAEAE